MKRYVKRSKSYFVIIALILPMLLPVIGIPAEELAALPESILKIVGVAPQPVSLSSGNLGYGDVNGDGVINGADRDIIVDYWFTWDTVID